MNHLYTGSKAMVRKEAVRRATLTHRSHHGKLDHGQRWHARREVLFPQRNFLQRKRDAGPLQDHEDPPVVHAGEDAREVSEKNPRVFRVTGSERDRSGLGLNDVSHVLGHTPLRRMDALEYFPRPAHTTEVTLLQLQLHRVACGTTGLERWCHHSGG